MFVSGYKSYSQSGILFEFCLDVHVRQENRMLGMKHVSTILIFLVKFVMCNIKLNELKALFSIKNTLFILILITKLMSMVVYSIWNSMSRHITTIM